jgi:calmodulin
MNQQDIISLTPKASPASFIRGLQNQRATALARISANSLLPSESSNDAENKQQQNQKPLHIVCCADCSGSMRGEKLEMTKRTLNFIVSELRPCDSFGLVQFATKVSTPFPLTALSSNEIRTTASRAIQSMVAMDQTNLSGGLFASLDLFANDDKNKTENNNIDPIRVVLLMTDGDANIGITDRTSLIRETKKWFDNFATKQSSSFASPPTIFTFGFGADHVGSLLQELAQTTEGTYSYVRNADQIAASYADCLGSLMSTVARNVVITASLPRQEENDHDQERAVLRLENSLSSTLQVRSQVSTDRKSISFFLKDLHEFDRKDLLVAVTLVQAPSFDNKLLHKQEENNAEEEKEQKILDFPLLEWNLSYLDVSVFPPQNVQRNFTCIAKTHDIPVEQLQQLQEQQRQQAEEEEEARKNTQATIHQEIEYVQSLTEEQIAEFREAFALFDRDGDGSRISVDQLMTVLRSLGQNPSEADKPSIEARFGILRNPDGSLAPNSATQIDFDDFVKYLASQMRDTDCEEEIAEAVRVFDRDGTGRIGVSELRHVEINSKKNIFTFCVSILFLTKSMIRNIL